MQWLVGYLVVFGSAISLVIVYTFLLVFISNKLSKKPTKHRDWTKNLRIDKSSFSGWFYDRKSNRR